MTQASVGFHCPECTKANAQTVIRGRDIRSRTDTPITVGLIIANALIFLVQGVAFGDPATSLQREGLLFGPAVQSGDWWRIITSGFLHGSLIHVGANMWALWIFGPPLERALGRARFALAYLAGLLGGAAAVMNFNFDAPTLGASGAVLGLAGALSALLWARGVSIMQSSLGGVLLINLALPLLVPIISFWGHLGGIAGGFAAGWLLAWLPERYGRSSNEAVSATAALCVVLAALALLGPSLLGIG